MKAIYFFRVALISIELVVMLAIVIGLNFFEDHANSVASSMNINEELAKWIILLPISLFAWCVNESYNLIFANQDHSKLLVSWHNYWRLKQHIVIGLLYSIAFCFLAAYPWLSAAGIKSGRGLIIFSFSCIGSLVVASHLFFAKMRINEILLNE